MSDRRRNWRTETTERGYTPVFDDEPTLRRREPFADEQDTDRIDTNVLGAE